WRGLCPGPITPPPCFAWFPSPAKLGRNSELHEHLPRIRAAKQAKERPGHLLQPLDHGLARFDRYALQPATHVAVKFVHAREIVEHQEALKPDAGRDDPGEEAQARRFGPVIALDHSAYREACIVARDGERGVEVASA